MYDAVILGWSDSFQESLTGMTVGSIRMIQDLAKVPAYRSFLPIGNNKRKSRSSILLHSLTKHIVIFVQYNVCMQ